METIRLTLSAPIASYASTPRLQHRLTDVEPTPTAIQGLIRCALGLRRGEPGPDVQVRVVESSHAGQMRDFQTIRGAATYSGLSGRAAITTRHYLTEACSVVEVSGKTDVIQQIANALECPRWQLYLGRRSCVCDRPVIHRPSKIAETQ